jgi:hypothetical protein
MMATFFKALGITDFRSVETWVDELAGIMIGMCSPRGVRFPTQIYTRGCHWIPRMFA